MAIPSPTTQVLHRFLGVSDREARLIIETEMGRKLPDDFDAEVKEATLKFYAGDLKAIAHVADAIARDRSAEMRGFKRHAGKNPPGPGLHRALRAAGTAHFFGSAGHARQARARPVPVRRRNR